MSAFRGARLLSSLGHHGIRCNRLHQRRIMSLGLTSLCQVTMKKKALLDTSALPVNKYDLSNAGILSSTISTLFSAEATIPTEDESDITNSEDSEVCLVVKWVSSFNETVAKMLAEVLLVMNSVKEEYNTASLLHLPYINNVFGTKFRCDISSIT